MTLEASFTSLSKRQTMLLLTAVTFGGQGCVETLDHLPEEEAEILRHRAAELLQIPREKRIPLLVTEIKRMILTARGALWTADPTQLGQLLQNERPVAVELLMRAFPAAVSEAIRAQLPAMQVRMRKGFEVRPEVLNVLRWKLAEILERAGARRGHFKFSDLLRLQPRELLTLCDQLGARVLAHALAGLTDRDRELLIRGLAPGRRQLCARHVAAAGQRKLDEQEAKEALAPHLWHGPAIALRSAGAQRVARACLAQSAEFAARLLEKHRGEFGALLAKWVREERRRAVNRGDGGRTEVVAEMERLELAGLINKPVSMLPPPKKAPLPVRPPLPRPAPYLNRLIPAAQALEGQPGRARPLLGPPPLARDWVAERAARRAGAASPRFVPPPEKSRASAITAPLPDEATHQELTEREAHPPSEVLISPVSSGPSGGGPPANVATAPSPSQVHTSPATQRLPGRWGKGEGTAVARRPRTAATPGGPGEVSPPGEDDGTEGGSG